MTKKAAKNHIAIIGASCRLPGEVNDLKSYWNILANGVDAVTELPVGRFSLERFFSKLPNLEGHCYTKAAGIVNHIKDFEPSFFGISNKEAINIDPQQRMLLETSWEAFEHAGIKPSEIKGSNTGVYIGASNMDFSVHSSDAPTKTTAYSMTGSALSIISNRISYIYDLHGPSLTVDTACSSSLVALHIACEALRNGQINLALVGGVNALLSPYPFIGFAKAQMLSLDGRCKAFDAAANGYARSEGAGCLILKPLQDAIKDNNLIMGVIEGTAVNSDGRSHGIALPNEAMQTKILEETYNNFNLDKKELVYVEAHGTGTAAGDPVETSALGNALAKHLSGIRPLYIGSVKSNIGHLEPAAGIAGIIKSLLVFKHKKIPPNVHFKTPNPNIDFDALNIKVPSQITPLPQVEKGGLISVNSFGFGGTNAHAVLREFTASSQKTAEKSLNVSETPLFLSAKHKNSLIQQAKAYADLIKETEESELYNIACSAAFNKESLESRSVFFANSKTELIKQLEAFVQDTTEYKFYAQSVAQNAQGAFVFSGNGSQWFGMGKDLFHKSPLFKETIKKIDNLLAKLQDWSLVEMISNPEDFKDLYLQAEYSQPLLFAIQVGIVEYLASKGIKPTAVLGHSVGEVAAAYTAGALSLEDAVKVIHYRSHLLGELKNLGHMAVANISLQQAQELLAEYNGELVVAAINTEKSLTVSGETTLLQAFVKKCTKLHHAAKMTNINYPFHSHLVESIKDKFISSLKDLKPQKPTIEFLSTVEGYNQDNKVLDADYWWKNMRNTVNFNKAVGTAISQGILHFMEIGAHPILQSYLRNIFSQHSVTGCYLSALKNNADEYNTLQDNWKLAWLKGWNIDFKQIFLKPYKRKELPVYTWNREYCWLERTPEHRSYFEGERLHPLLGWALPLNPSVYENVINTVDFSWLNGHIAGNSTIFPAAGMIETILAAAKETYQKDQVEIERLSILRAFDLSKNLTQSTRIKISKEDGSFLYETRPYMSGEPFATVFTGRIKTIANTPKPSELSDIDKFKQNAEIINKDALYQTAKDFFLNYKENFQTVKQAWVNKNKENAEVFAELETPCADSAKGMLIAPTLLDGAFHTLFLLLGKERDKNARKVYLPSFFDEITLFAEGQAKFVHTQIERISPRSVVARFKLFDATGKPLIELRGCRFRRAFSLESEFIPNKAYHQVLEPSLHSSSKLHNAKISLEKLTEEITKSVNEEFTKLNTKNNNALSPYLLLRFISLTSAYDYISEILKVSQKELFNINEQISLKTIKSEQEAWLYFIMEVLEQAEFVKKENEGWRLLPDPNRPQTTQLWQTLIAEYPNYATEAALLSYLINFNQKSLKENPPLTLPQSLQKQYFNHSVMLTPFVKGIETCLSNYLNSNKDGKAIKILQLAKDSQTLLNTVKYQLDDLNISYTNIENNANQAEALNKVFFKNKTITSLSLNLEEELTDDYKNKFYNQNNLILIANCLYESKQAPKILDNAFKMLSPNGILCLSEHEPDNFTDYIFGIQPEWWNDSIDNQNPVSRFQSKDEWITHLNQAGFKNIQTISLNDPQTGPGFILLAQKPEETTQELIVEQAKQENKNYLILTKDSQTAGYKLATQIKEQLSINNISVTIIESNTKKDIGSLFELKDWKQLLANYDLQNYNILFLNAFEENIINNPSELLKQQTENLNNLGTLATALDELKFKERLWVITGGALSLTDYKTAKSKLPQSRLIPSQGAVWGFTKVLMSELRHLNVHLLDLHNVQGINNLVQELLAPSKERELVFADDLRLSPRIKELNNYQEKAKPIKSAKLDFDIPGRLQNLYWRETEAKQVADDEVGVLVKAVGLNFRDVMWSLGMLLDESLENGFSGPGMGIECTGVITSLGKNVQDWKVGDEVLCFAPSCFQTQVTTKADAIIKKPTQFSFAEAATIPVTFTTAWYSLKHLAKLKAGERVLIHGAAGGVGLAAIQIAQHLGLEIYATAGATEKQAFLKQFNIKGIYSSRSLAFVEQIKEATNGEGVDAVLNSLSGEAISASISLLRPFGRFLELGKRDFYADSALRLRPFSNNLTFYGVDLDQLLLHKPILARELLQELMTLFEQKIFTPLPYTNFKRTQTVDAFQAMQQAGQIGKLVITMESDETQKDIKALVEKQAKLTLNSDATYLVTGGTAGFGFATALRLIQRGAKHLILLSRSGVKNIETQNTIEDFNKKGCKIKICSADVSDDQALQTKLDEALQNMPPLKGIIHAAAVLEDGVISGLTPKRLENALSAKSIGAWNLHNYSLSSNLDFFVLYSSATTAFGNPGQAAYVAANGMLETLVGLRKQQNLSAQFIGWGPVDDVGMLENNPKARLMLTNMLGADCLKSELALDWLENSIMKQIEQSHYFACNWQGKSSENLFSLPRFEFLSSQKQNKQSMEKTPQEMIKGVSQQEALQIFANIVCKEIANVLMISVDYFKIDTPLVQQGIDSLMAVECGIALNQRFGLNNYVFALNDKTTALSIAKAMYEMLSGQTETEHAKVEQSNNEEQILEQLNQQHALNLTQQQREKILRNS
ncbi:type I polyketide synthase [Desulfovibrio litoralis]|uniref:Acyl transferase domain-containing protein n=1 Tax=Desulfovibrio litoralis DSM 11393 TaxID=1121455 RepID=A0A1M7TMW6_9BACT|nr:type I polyketide synthase [Desulfovibrio litoralis]SHN72055.1 Acyl transferase domain-containing protein [Desulfovibrio litoralis DSM 11393]